MDKCYLFVPFCSAFWDLSQWTMLLKPGDLQETAGVMMPSGLCNLTLNPD